MSINPSSVNPNLFNIESIKKTNFPGHLTLGTQNGEKVLKIQQIKFLSKEKKDVSEDLYEINKLTLVHLSEKTGLIELPPLNMMDKDKADALRDRVKVIIENEDGSWRDVSHLNIRHMSVEEYTELHERVQGLMTKALGGNGEEEVEEKKALEKGRVQHLGDSRSSSTDLSEMVAINVLSQQRAAREKADQRNQERRIEEQAKENKIKHEETLQKTVDLSVKRILAANKQNQTEVDQKVEQNKENTISNQ